MNMIDLTRVMCSHAWAITSDQCVESASPAPEKPLTLSGTIRANSMLSPPYGFRVAPAMLPMSEAITVRKALSTWTARPLVWIKFRGACMSSAHEFIIVVIVASPREGRRELEPLLRRAGPPAEHSWGERAPRSTGSGLLTRLFRSEPAVIEGLPGCLLRNLERGRSTFHPGTHRSLGILSFRLGHFGEAFALQHFA